MKSNDRPNQYQFAAFAYVDGERLLVHAGVHGAARLNRRAAVKAQRDWLAWRVQSVPRGKIPRCTHMLMYPINNHHQRRLFAL